MNWRNPFSGYGRMLGLALGLAAFVLVALQIWQRHDELLPLWRRMDVAHIAAALILCVLVQGLFGLSWHVLARGRVERASLVADQLRWGQSLMAKYLPGKIWQGVARGALYGEERHVGAVFVLFVREQLLSLGISALIAAACAPAALPATLGWWFRCGFVAAAFVLTAIAALRRLPAAVRVRLPASLAAWNSAPPAPAALLRAWLAQFAAYLAMCAAFATLADGFGLQLGWLQLSAALCFAGLAGVAALFVPAGLGVREAGLFWCLSPALGPGNAAMLAVAWRVAITAGEGSVALLALAAGSRRR
ncbi:lysylphosphatidylglycerol synthase domain-containing protein [Lysobacter sp. Hz 25]|uniref:lysylphosphatidylglycerol synthase domain-containing protein n=1 Tax=Lysobacter sp. Hz 25 TaxID=3383698 RepID=UPI0038D51849